MKTLSRSVLLLLAGIACAPFAAAQTQFNIRVLQGHSGFTIADGGTVNLAAEAPRTPVSAAIAITYRGTGTVSFSRAAFTGSVDFEFTGLPEEAPVTIASNQTLTISARYVPRSSGRATGILSLTYTEPGRSAATLTLNFTGTAPEYAFSFIPQGGNATPLVAGGTIAFPLTAVDTTSTAVVVITNRGTAPGIFQSASVSGAAYQLAGVPLAGSSIEAGREVRFNVNFTPKQLGTSTGTLLVDVAGLEATFQLSGSGSGAAFTYEVVQPAPAPLAPDGPIAAPDTPVGEKSSLVIRVRNNGNADGRITAIAAQGAAFQLSDIPFLPLTLAPGAATQFTLTFSPPEAGRATGRLRVGDVSFDLVGTGLSAVLTYAYVVGDASTPVSAGGNVFFTPAALGRSSTVQFRISNTGTLAGAVTSIAIAGSNVFTIADLPAFPAQVAPGEALQVNLVFTPTALGAATATLRVNAVTFNLTASGTNPAPLPEYRLEGPSGTVEPRQQPTIRLTLARPYSLPVHGTLTLTFSSDVFSDDPAVQFATGGRTIAFLIPANSTQAVFPDGSNQVRLQTGTVAGTITLTPSFSTESGVSLTPANPPSLRFSVPQGPPRLLNAVLTAKTTSGFTIQVTGYATSRSITRMNVQFTPRQGETLETTSLALNVESSFLAWYQSSQSQAFGSLFSVTIPFTLTGDVKANNITLADTVQSLSVTATNAQGTSAPLTVELK